MKYQDIKDAAVAIFNSTNQIPLYISGKPGLGKTTVAYGIARELKVPQENVVIFRPSLRDPTDIMGLPRVENGLTHWTPPAELHRLSAGRNLLVIDELPQGTPMMQNALAGLMLDRFVGDLHVSDETFILATGNRVQDKAGAGRVMSQLANRVMHLEMEASLDDWTEWALTNGIDTTLIAFMRFRPGLLCDFEPDRFSNATPRSWEKVAYVPTTLPGSIYLQMVQGLVGEGAGAEYVGFRRIADALPSPDAAMLDPTGCPIPDDPAALYAYTGALAVRASKGNFDSIATIADRMPPEFGVLLVKDSVRLKPEVTGTRAFVNWSVKNKSVLM